MNGRDNRFDKSSVPFVPYSGCECMLQQFKMSGLAVKAKKKRDKRSPCRTAVLTAN